MTPPRPTSPQGEGKQAGKTVVHVRTGASTSEFPTRMVDTADAPDPNLRQGLRRCSLGRNLGTTIHRSYKNPSAG